jgi:drug/metabolite transporter (DMT)-like permease
MWVAGLKHIPANQAGVFTVALPIAATLVGVLLLDEQFSALHAAALACASAGVLLIGATPIGHRASPGVETRQPQTKSSP